MCKFSNFYAIRLIAYVTTVTFVPCILNPFVPIFAAAL